MRLSTSCGRPRSEMSQTITRNMQTGEKADPAVTELLGKLFDPRAWFSSTGGMDEALQRMAEGPRLADLWDTERKMLNAVQCLDGATPAQPRAQYRHAGSLDAGGRHFRQRPQRKGGPQGDARLLARRARALGRDREYRPARNAAFGRAISRASGKSSRRAPICASRSRRWRPSTARCSAIPTRAELDDVHRTVTELRRELRALQRAGRRAAERTDKAREAIAAHEPTIRTGATPS